jgi:predicted secreted hydrolase
MLPKLKSLRNEWLKNVPACRPILSVVIAMMVCLHPSQGLAESSEYLQVIGPCGFDFPRDHGAHPGYRTEWWYYTGNVETEAGRRFGFQVTFFRTRIGPTAAGEVWPEAPSPWRTDQLYLAHLALSDLEEEAFFKAEKVSRGAVGLAGVECAGGRVRVFLQGWSVSIDSETHRLSGAGDGLTLDLNARPAKGPVSHGEQGYSRKGERPESASCYYSFTRLLVSGNLKIKGNFHRVSGTAWMDHEYSSAPLEEDLTGWDWFSIQLSDNREIMLYLLRKGKGQHSRASSGTFVDPSGGTRHLRREEFSVEVLDRWESPRTGAVYPSRWKIEVIPLGMSLVVVPNVSDQEMVTEMSTGVTYWEGSVSVEGQEQGKPVTGMGYVELTGYAEPFRLGD